VKIYLLIIAVKKENMKRTGIKNLHVQFFKYPNM